MKKQKCPTQVHLQTESKMRTTTIQPQKCSPAELIFSGQEHKAHAFCAKEIIKDKWFLWNRPSFDQCLLHWQRQNSSRAGRGTKQLAEFPSAYTMLIREVIFVSSFRCAVWMGGPVTHNRLYGGNGLMKGLMTDETDGRAVLWGATTDGVSGEGVWDVNASRGQDCMACCRLAVSIWIPSLLGWTLSEGGEVIPKQIKIVNKIYIASSAGRLEPSVEAENSVETP